MTAAAAAARAPATWRCRSAGAAAAAAPAAAGGAGRGRGGDRLKNLAEYYEAARRHSDKNFLILPDEENTAGNLGGHTDFVLSHPVYWTPTRTGRPAVHRAASDLRQGLSRRQPADTMEMAKLENMLVFMPHPRSKGSTGYPDAVKDKAHFIHENYRGIGFRWGMGVDGSETRLCEYRCLALLDDMNNWVADLPTPPKYAWAITETYQKGPGDDIYANNPVNYVKLDKRADRRRLEPDRQRDEARRLLLDVGRSADPVLRRCRARAPSAPSRSTSSGRSRSSSSRSCGATARRPIGRSSPATDLPPFGKHHFQIPFDATGKKWVRFAAWDSVGNGAIVQPIKLSSATTTTAAGR